MTLEIGGITAHAIFDILSRVLNADESWRFNRVAQLVRGIRQFTVPGYDSLLQVTADGWVVSGSPNLEWERRANQELAELRAEMFPATPGLTQGMVSGDDPG